MSLDFPFAFTENTSPWNFFSNYQHIVSILVNVKLIFPVVSLGMAYVASNVTQAVAIRPGLPAGQNPSNLNFTLKMFFLCFLTLLLPAWFRRISSDLPYEVALLGHLWYHKLSSHLKKFFYYCQHLLILLLFS